MATYITVDGGTTNTRVTLVKDSEILASEKFSLGARTSIDDRGAQRVALKGAIERLLASQNMSECDIDRIIASGMITSEFGLIKLDHIAAPASIKELHDSMYETVLDDISSIPFVFIRGVKLMADVLEECDVMRGEETELIGLGARAEYVYILPGSHSKIIYTDNSGAISRFYTMLTGEMIGSLSSATILKDAVDLSITSIDDKALINGYEYATKNGLNEALFKVRILNNFLGATKAEVYSFFMGAVLSGEINKVIALNPAGVVVAGKEQLKLTTAKLLKHASSLEVEVAPSALVDSCVVRGAISIYENK